MKFVVRTDAHVSNKPPESRTDDYLDTCVDKLRQIADIARDRDARAVIDNGDFFHRTGRTGNPYSMIKRLIDLHRDDYPCPVYENPGNHDFPYGRISHVEYQPLGVMFSSGIFDRLEDELFEGDGQTVRIVGKPYDPDRTLAELDVQKEDEDVLIVASHQFASPQGGSMFGEEEAFSYHDLAQCDPDMYIFGHWHIDQGIDRIEGTTFMNLGSMTRGSLVQDNLDRTPRVGVVEVSNGKIDCEAVKLDVQPAEEVFDLEEHRRRKRDEQSIDKFVESMKASESVTDEEDIYDQIEDLSDFKEDVRRRAISYLRDVEG